jgi:transcriptional regulator with XRE-family HTH domain
MIMYRSVSQPTASAFTARRDGLRRLFGSMVQDRRETIQRPVEDCARLAGMESSEWAAIEAGYVPADPAKLRSMAAALEIRYDQLLMMVHLCQDAWAE